MYGGPNYHYHANTRREALGVDVKKTKKCSGLSLLTEYAPVIQHGRPYVWCQCKCGKQVLIRKDHFNSAHTISCGCAPTGWCTHGLSHTRCYSIWVGMKQRCNNPKSRSYARYGGRGIKMCKRWERSFEKFYTDIGGEIPQGLTVDRIDNNKGYSPKNVQLITLAENSAKTSKVYPVAQIDVETGVKLGEYKSMAEAQRQTGISSIRICEVVGSTSPITTAGGFKWEKIK